MKTLVARTSTAALFATLLTWAAAAASEPATQAEEPPQHLFQTDLIAFPDPWSFMLGRSGVTMVSDQQLIDLAADPDKEVNVSISSTPQLRTLRQICEQAKARGHRTLSIAFDYFFAQYRTEAADVPRRLWPDTDRYIELIGKISQFAKQYGLGIELSLLSPLEIGHGYRETTGETGRWMHYREGLRDPQSGAYSVQLWRQRAWTNNKGTFRIKDAGVRVFAFRERRVGGTPYYAVKPDEIVEITDTAAVEVYDALQTGRRTIAGSGADPADLAGYSAVRIRIHGTGRADVGPLDRVLVVQVYDSPEMDYFSPTAAPFLREMIDKYVAAGVHFNAIYADETHIQGDWSYFSHHDHGAFATRYVSPGLERMFADRHGEQYADFAKWLVYFARGQHDTANDLTAASGAMHVIGPEPAQIRRTALLRARYYELLQNHVVDLFAGAKSHLERRMGHQIHSMAHATWAESPTIDNYDAGHGNGYAQKYEYTSNFIWSNTVHQAASACHDYFKWGDFLHGTGNDTAECGWLDRNYWGFSLASSLGVLNRVPNAYAAHWGMPAEVSRRRSALCDAWGTWPSPPFAIVEDSQHREVEVLMLYPLDLVAVDERFGSWMTQYAYANWITQAKLLERGRVVDGLLEVAGRRYTTLVATFAPFPEPELLAMMEKLAGQGGRVVWSGPPPLVTRDGDDALQRWQEMTGVHYNPTAADGTIVPGRRVEFSGVLAGLEAMIVLTDLLPDRAYPVEAANGAETVVTISGQVVGTHRRLPDGGSVTYLGFRPRDDQSMMTGHDHRYWFDILRLLGCYQPSGAFADVQDDTEHISRTTGYFTARFPNGAISIAPHLRHLEEAWPGGFQRDAAQDAEIVKTLDLPSEQIALDAFKVNGHSVDYRGASAMAFRVDDQGRLIAFAGRGCREITIDGRQTVFADGPMPLVAWAPVPENRRVEGGAAIIVRAAGDGPLSIPAPDLQKATVYREGPTPGSRGAAVENRIEDGLLVFQPNPGVAWYYVVRSDETSFEQ